MAEVKKLDDNKTVAENKKAIEELRRGKAFMENLIASMKDGFSILDNKGVHIDVNTALCRMTGFLREELIGIGQPHPYWPQEEYKNIEKAFKKTLQGEFAEFELTFMRKNGQRFPVIVSPSWIKDEQGRVISYYATVKDITERKKAEETINNLAKFPSENPNPVLRIAKDGKVLYSNKAGFAVLDKWKSKIEEKVPKRWRQIITEKFASMNLKEGKEEVNDKTFSFVAAPVPDAGYANLYGHDITDRKKVEKALKKSEEELREDKLALEQKNLALKELIEHMERTKNKTKEDIAINIEESVIPILKKLRLKGLSPKYVDLLCRHFDELTSSFGRKITQASPRLSSREIEISNLIKGGLRSKEISELLNISYKTIDKHRRNIRKKLGISKRRANLTSFLQKL